MVELAFNLSLHSLTPLLCNGKEATKQGKPRGDSEKVFAISEPTVPVKLRQAVSDNPVWRGLPLADIYPLGYKRA